MLFTKTSVQVKKKKKTIVEDVMGNGVTDKTYIPAVVDTPAPSSEDSDSDQDKVCTRLSVYSSASVHSELVWWFLMM